MSQLTVKLNTPELELLPESKARQIAEVFSGIAHQVNDNDLEDLKTKYQFKSKKNRNMLQNVQALLDKTILFILDKKGTTEK